MTHEARSEPAELAEIRATVAELLGAAADPLACRRAMATPLGYDEKLWRAAVADLGILGLLAPERCGGLGLDLRAGSAVLAVWDGRLVPGPAHAALLGVAVLAGCATDAADELLTEIVESGLTPAVAVVDGIAPRTLDMVEFGYAADLVVVVDDAGLSVARAPAGRSEQFTIDPTRRWARLVTTAPPVPVAGPDAADAARATRLALAAASAAAAGSAALRQTAAYLTVRKQFGSVLGSFQALAHRAADLAVLLEGATATAERALADLADDPGSAEAQLLAQVAAVVAVDGYLETAGEMIQLHGGIAITWEHDAHLHFKRAKVDQALLGTNVLRERLAAHLGLVP